ncbi:MAG TPA: PilZ domain-containing protein [Vicinamibacteria bacterium]|nr:PilZ domain-containing protein [Vicinamibacteria bacterium]
MDHRLHTRFTVEGIHGKMILASHVDILNMSISGVAVKVDRALRVGGEYALSLQLQNRQITVHALVVWCVLGEIRKGTGGEAVPVYSAGMKFTDVLSPKLMELISFIDRHKIVEEHRLGGLRVHIDAPGKALLDVPHAYRVKVISMSGMLIEMEEGLELDRICPMEFSLKPGGEPIRCSGRIVYCVETVDQETRRHEIGVAFEDMDLEEQKRLAEYIESISK